MAKLQVFYACVYGPNLVWVGGGAQYWFPRLLCIMLHHTHEQLCSRAFFKDSPVGGGAFFEKGPFCEIYISGG